MAMSRLDTRLESEGAEFLVLGQLLIHRIAAYKTYTNMLGYDLVATHPERKMFLIDIFAEGITIFEKPRFQGKFDMRVHQ